MLAGEAFGGGSTAAVTLTEQSYFLPLPEVYFKGLKVNLLFSAHDSRFPALLHKHLQYFRCLYIVSMPQNILINQK